MATNFSSKCDILAELWMNYRQDENFEDFVEYNDMGLPLAYFIHTNMVTPTNEAKIYIDETFDLLIAAIQADPDEEYRTLNELLRSVTPE
jgi:hypothetical protein